ncbi:MAG: sulfotransferase [Alphaproteobacteria bacterium]|nr:sulfotransferase [Alphaproteobacteria bacterium]
MSNAFDPETEKLLDAAKRAYAGGDKPGAAALARQALLRRPGDAAALQILGVVALDTGDAASARRHLEASNAARTDAVTFNMIGVAAGRMGDVVAARSAFTRAGEMGLVDGWRNLGVTEKGDAQVAAYQRALALAPNDAASHAGLAHAFEARHDLTHGKEHAAAALRLDAGNVIARLALARVLLRERDFAGAEAAVEPIVQSARTPAELRVQALGLVGDSRDRRDDAQGAFQAFTAANQISLQLHGAWLDATERLYHPASVRRLQDVVAGLDVTGWSSPIDTRSPVFFVGFPRSGTTLLDQILSSHSDIVCLEESEHFSDALGDIIHEPSRAFAPATLSEEELQRIRESYWRRVGEQPASIVVDKYPLNIVVLPLIKRVFPAAKVIFALRDPRDVVLSCFQQRFTINAAMAQFLEVERAGAYYDQVMALFELCRARLNLNLHQVRYEDVVGDLERAARELCGFLGAPYEEAMLNYRETALKRDIATPSARQVIEPLYNRSIGRWRRYEEELKSVLPVLAPWAQRYGYAP